MTPSATGAERLPRTGLRWRWRLLMLALVASMSLGLVACGVLARAGMPDLWQEEEETAAAASNTRGRESDESRTEQARAQSQAQAAAEEDEQEEAQAQEGAYTEQPSQEDHSQFEPLQLEPWQHDEFLEDESLAAAEAQLPPSDFNAVLVNVSVVESLAAEVAQLRPGDIPQWIHTTWISWVDLRPNERAAAKSWVQLNPGWRYYFWDNRAVKAFLRRQLSSMEYQMVVLMKPVEVADIFRYVVMERLGGLYCDIDVEPVLPIEEWFARMPKPRPQLVTGWESRFTNASEKKVVGFARMDQVQQWLILSSPHHPILRDVMVRIFTLFKETYREDIGGAGLGTVELTGPGPWTDAVLAHIADAGAGGLPPSVGHGEGKANQVSLRGNNSVELLPKECFAWYGYLSQVGNASEILANHRFKGSWH